MRAALLEKLKRNFWKIHMKLNSMILENYGLHIILKLVMESVMYKKRISVFTQSTGKKGYPSNAKSLSSFTISIINKCLEKSNK